MTDTRMEGQHKAHKNAKEEEDCPIPNPQSRYLSSYSMCQSEKVVKLYKMIVTKVKEHKLAIMDHNDHTLTGDEYRWLSAALNENYDMDSQWRDSPGVGKALWKIEKKTRDIAFNISYKIISETFDPRYYIPAEA